MSIEDKPVSRRRRKTEATRETILEAARTVLASDGPEALSLSKVAHLAGINRGTAYQHFQTRDDLIKATVASVSELLSSRVFGGLGIDADGRVKNIEQRPIYEVISKLVDFAVENPALGRIWLFETLSSGNPGEDIFFRQFKEGTRGLAESNLSQSGIDIEALSVLMLAGYFLWPEWVRAHAKTDEERSAMAARMRHEVLRLFLHGVLKPDKFPQLEDLLAEASAFTASREQAIESL